MNINKWGALQIEKGACYQTNSQCQNSPKSFSTNVAMAAPNAKKKSKIRVVLYEVATLSTMVLKESWNDTLKILKEPLVYHKERGNFLSLYLDIIS